MNLKGKIKMTIDTRGIEINELQFINQVGKYLLKITKWEKDGFDANGNDRFKIFFEGVVAGTKEPKYLHSERFSVAQNMLWKIKQLEVALQSPEVYHLDSWVGRWVIANVAEETYTKNDGSQGKSYKVKSWEYSKINDKLDPIPEAKQDKNNDTNVAEVDVSDDECPF